MKYLSSIFKHVRVTHQILIRKAVPLFENVKNVSDIYVCNIDVIINEFIESSINIECEDFTPWFKIKKSKIRKETVGKYALFAIQ